MRGRLRALAGCGVLAIAVSCKPVASPANAPPRETPAEVLANFIAAADAGDFQRAYALLSGAWKARYTPERLKQDFDDEPLARERLARARAALNQVPIVRGDVAEFPIGANKAVRLVRENGDFRVAALE